MQLCKRLPAVVGVALGLVLAGGLLTACGGQTAVPAQATAAPAARVTVVPPAATRSPAVTASHTGMVRGTVWVANEYGNSITAIDANTNNVITTLTGIEGPHNLQVAPDGKSVWAVSGHESLAVMIDAATYQLHGSIPTGKEPAHIVLTPDGKTAYATNGRDDTVTAIDVASMKAVATIPVGCWANSSCAAATPCG